MKNTLYIFAKIFITISLFFGLGLIIPIIFLFTSFPQSINYPTKGFVLILLSPIIGGLLFGLTMILIFGSGHLYNVYKISNGNPFIYSPIQKRTINIKIRFTETIKYCVDKLLHLPAKIITIQNKLVIAHTFTHTGTAIDEIRIVITEQGELENKITIISQPISKIMQLDFGRNYSNIERLISLLDVEKFIEEFDKKRTK